MLEGAKPSGHGVDRCGKDTNVGLLMRTELGEPVLSRRAARLDPECVVQENETRPVNGFLRLGAFDDQAHTEALREMADDSRDEQQVFCGEGTGGAATVQSEISPAGAVGNESSAKVVVQTEGMEDLTPARTA